MTATTTTVTPTTYVVSKDLLDYAEHNDSSEAEALLDAVESKSPQRELMSAAKTFFDFLVAEDILEEEDREDMLGNVVVGEGEDGLDKDETMAAIDGADDIDALAASIDPDVEVDD